MTDPTQQSEADSVTGATVTKTIGQVVHEAGLLSGEAEGEFAHLDEAVKADLERFGKIIEHVVAHVLAKRAQQPAG